MASDINYTNTAASLLFKVKKNQLKMMNDRGYDITGERPLFDYSVADFVRQYSSIAEQRGTTFKEALTGYYNRDNGDSIYVYYAETPSESKQLGKAQVQDLANSIKDNASLKNVVIISDVSLSPDAKAVFEGLPMYQLEFFLILDLSYNPNDHYLTPKHHLMTKEEAREFLQRNKIKIEQMPYISRGDPVVRWYGARTGQIFKITRELSLADTMVSSSLFYRAVRDIPLVKDNKTAKK